MLFIVFIPNYQVLLHLRWFYLSLLTLLFLSAALSSGPDVTLCWLWFLWCFLLLLDSEIIKFLQTFLCLNFKMASISMRRLESSMFIFQAIGFPGLNSNIIIKKFILIDLNNDRFMFFLFLFLDPNKLIFHLDHSFSFLRHVMISKHLNSLFSCDLRCIRLSIFLIFEI